MNQDLQFYCLTNNEEIPWDLLLLADPSRENVEKYLHKGECYVASLKGQVVGAFVLLEIGDKVLELMNIVVSEEFQGQGIGKQLLNRAISIARDKGAKTLEVGTGNSSIGQLAFYQKAGFRIIGVERDFFLRNYEEEIIENGIRCFDMIRLSMVL